MRKAPGIEAVWMVETDGALALPETVPAVVDDYFAWRVRAAKWGIATRSFGLALAAGLFALSWAGWGPGWRTIFYLGVVITAAGALESMFQLRQARRLDAGVFADAREAHRHDTWVKSQSAALTWWMIVCLLAVALMAFVADDRAVAAAGLVKERVWQGEVWRVLTGPVLHVNLGHAWMNLAALLVLGRIVEAHAPRTRLPLVFVLSALAGSAASTLLLPVSSIGASGGVLGVLAYLTVLAHRRPGEFPAGFPRRLLYAAGATGVLGVLGFVIIDNAAHAGGYAAGLLLGHVLVSRARERGGEPVWLRAAGYASLTVFTAAVLATIFAVFRGPPLPILPDPIPLPPPAAGPPLG